MEHYDILIIGAGAAGIAAGKAAWEKGCRRIALADGKTRMGGILLQCAHRGFGKNLDGPEYTAQLLEAFPEGIARYPNTQVLSVTKEKTALLCGPETGRIELSFHQLILAAGCREIPIGALPVGGTRPRGVYTAGQMQEMMNLHGFVPEGPVVILGSGDLGLVMANHMAERGLSVTLVEQRDTCGGMARNRRCLQEYPIRLICGDTLAAVLGHPHITGCITARGVELPCRTLLIAVGLRPERELVLGLEQEEWLHICGNCNHVHPMVESVVNEGKQAGIAAAENWRAAL